MPCINIFMNSTSTATITTTASSTATTTTTLVDTSPTQSQTAGVPRAAEGILEKMGLLQGEVKKVLANPAHGRAVEALFHATSPFDAPLTFVSSAGFQRRSDAALPSNFASLAHALAEHSPRLAVALLTVALTCTADAGVKDEIAIACATACAQVCRVDQNDAVLENFKSEDFQHTLLELITRKDIDSEVKRLCLPLLEYGGQQKSDALPRAPMSGNSSSNSSASSSHSTGSLQTLPIHPSSLSRPDSKIHEDFAKAINRDSTRKLQALLQGRVVEMLYTPLPPTNQTALMLAISLGKENAVTFLVAMHMKAGEKGLLYDFSQAIELAKSSGHEEFVKILESGARGVKLIKADLDRQGESVLHLAAQVGGSTTVQEIFRQMPDLDINQKNNQGSTPLHIAVESGSTDIVGALLSRPKININLKDNNGCTPLALAVENGDLAMVRLLLLEPGIQTQEVLLAAWERETMNW